MAATEDHINSEPCSSAHGTWCARQTSPTKRAARSRARARR